MTGRSVLVTGGSRGIGLATARRLAAGGDRVAVTHRASPPPAGLLGVKCDVTSEDSVAAAVAEAAQAHGDVAVLVASAGVVRDGLVLRMSEQAWAEVLDTNLAGAWRAARAVLPAMARARYGRIVFISSVVGLLGSAGQANYAAAKAGLVGLARSLAREYGPRGVTVNVVAPGFVDTDMTAGLTEAQRGDALARTPLARTATPEEVAAAVAFLASDDAAFITGAVLPVDGGLGMGH